MHQMDVSREHIEIVEGTGGPKARIRGTRIRVVDILGWHEGQRMCIAEIVEEFPHITRGDVYAALAYYWDNNGTTRMRSIGGSPMTRRTSRR
jgi:uncharacterized protein (DUF433 family)